MIFNFHIKNLGRKARSMWAQLEGRTTAKIAAVFLIFLFTLAIFADFIANDRPLYAHYNGEVHYPFLTPLRIDSVWNYNEGKYQKFAYNTVDWRSLPLESVVWPLIPYSPNRLDPHNRKPIPPGAAQFYETYWGELKPIPRRLRHWLGTYTNGQDVLAGLIHGARISLMVGILSVLIAFFIGIFVGSLAGFYGDTRLKTSRARYLLTFLSLFFAYFYGFYVRRYTLTEAGEEGALAFLGAITVSFLWAFTSIFLGQKVGKFLGKMGGFLGKEIAFPIDWWVSRVIEILRSIPVILLIIAFSVVFGGSVVFVILIIGLTGWTGVARLIRAEFFRVVNLDYMEAGRALGFHERRLIFKHALPNAIGPVLVSISFGIAGAIMVESMLSFLNIGVGPDVVTWGTLLRKGRSNFDMWWLTVFPGFMIFLTVLAFNLLGERLRDVLDPRDELHNS